MDLADIQKDDPVSLSVIIMAYNEVANLGFVFQEVLAECTKAGRPYELIIVDDGSTDGTARLAARLVAGRADARVIHHKTNLGIGEVLRTGFNASRNDLITLIPADGQYPAEIIGCFLPYMKAQELVLGFVPHRSSPLMAKVLSRCERLLLDVMFGRIPRFQGIYMFRRALLELFPLTTEGRGWIIQMELIIRAQRAGCRLISVPTSMRRRLSGVSKARNLKSVIANMRQAIQLYRRLSWST